MTAEFILPSFSSLPKHAQNPNTLKMGFLTLNTLLKCVLSTMIFPGILLCLDLFGYDLHDKFMDKGVRKFEKAGKLFEDALGNGVLFEY